MPTAPNPETQLATAPVNPGFHKATSALATTLGISPAMMVETLKKQCFPSMRAEDISDAQLVAFISVANASELNPLEPGMLYAYPSKNGGIVPVIGPDGVLKKLDEHITKDKIEGFECTVFPEDIALPPTHAVAKIYRKNNKIPSAFTAIFKEWVVGSNPNWTTRPRHMIWLRAIKQCARQVIHGLPFDADDLVIGDMTDVTPEAPQRPAAPPRAKKGAAAVVENPPAATTATGSTAKGGVVLEADFTEVTPTKEQLTQAEKDRLAADLAAREAKLKAGQPKAEAYHEGTDISIAPQRTPADPRIVYAPADQKILDDLHAKQAAAIKAKQATAPRTEIKDGEEITVRCQIKDVMPTMMSRSGVAAPSVQAIVEGEFTGRVNHYKGATGTDAANLKPLPVWQPGAWVTLKLLGKLNTIAKKITASVVEITPEAPADVQAEEA